MIKFLLKVALLSLLICGHCTAQTVYFSPNGGVTAQIVDKIKRAKVEVLMQAYNYTSAPIVTALCASKAKGVDVRLIADSSNLVDPYSAIKATAKCGVPVSIDAKHKIAHNKVIIIDNYTVLTGSFNYTAAAETSNAENELIINNKALAAMYRANWLIHFNHSSLYTIKD